MKTSKKEQEIDRNASDMRTARRKIAKKTPNSTGPSPQRQECVARVRRRGRPAAGRDAHTRARGWGKAFSTPSTSTSSRQKKKKKLDRVLCSLELGDLIDALGSYIEKTRRRTSTTKRTTSL
ncbi:hypothetical protein RRG08_007540 [Elysia crispata]|uniref:Uncharacterized protein n=1 Tax=Elysia crispata TaxID=231223 RepID=A0AAE0YEP6_9GAST|nr:hypothetical protein RRG08_007540 [Elysia crispata]